MDIISQLASQAESRGQEANVEVAERCIDKPELLAEIAARLSDKNARLVGDCAEVMTKVAEQRPELVVPYAEALLGLVLNHKNGRVRWESAHAVALVSSHVPKLIAGELERLGHLSRRDPGVIVRDYVLDALAGYASTGPKAAAAAFPYLREGLSAWNSKHAARVLGGLEGVARAAPKLTPEIRTLAAPFEEHARPGVRKAAKSLLKKLGASAA